VLEYCDLKGFCGATISNRGIGSVSSACRIWEPVKTLRKNLIELMSNEMVEDCVFCLIAIYLKLLRSQVIREGRNYLLLSYKLN
jgi:hypothetical protein